MDNVRPRCSCSPIKRSYYIKPALRPKDLKQDVKTFGVKNMTTIGKRAVVNTGKGKLDTDLHKSRWVWRPKENYLDHVPKDSGSFMLKKGNPEILLQDHTVVDSGCSSHMTGNKAYLSEYEDYNGGFMAFRSLSGKDKGPTQEYILLLLQPHKTRIPLNDVVQIAQEKLLKSSPDKDIQILKMFFEKEGQHHMPEDEQHLKKKRGKLHLKKKADQATNTNTLSTDRPFVSTDRPFVSTDRSNTPYVSTASTPTGAQCWSNQSVSILEAKYLNDASTLPNANYPLIQICLTWKMLLILSQMMEYSIELIRDEDVGAVADFNNMDNTIAVSPIPTLRILGDPTSAVQTRGKIQKASLAQQALVSYIHRQNRTNHKDHQICLFACFLSQEELKTISQALQDESWVEAMQEELLQFKLQKVWVLVDFPYGKKVIGTKWVFRNKRDERSIVVKNKARSRREAIRLFLAFASYMGFTVYQMDVKSAFLYGAIKEEVYVHQPPGFVDLAHPNKVYKVIKALYGLHQAPRAWYETLSSFLMENGFRRDTIDKTLFVKKKKSDIMLVQVYVDDIIFGSTTKSMCTEFEECTHKRFQMSFMGELTFFLGLQVKQQSDRIFISQDKYVADILKKFDFLSIRTATTPIESNKPLVKDEDGVDVDVHVYRYLKHQPKLGLWYLRDSPFELEAYSDSDYGGSNLDRKSTIDCYEKRLIEVIKIHTDHNAADLLTKGFDVTRFNFLVYSDKHNMLAFLKKPNESVGFTEVVDFIKVRTLANGTQQLVASIDSKEYTITEASVRSKLQLADATRIHNLSDAKIYAGLATLSPKSGGWNQFGDIVPLLPAMLAGAAMDQGEGSAQPAEPHPTPVDPLPSTSLPPNQSPPHSPHQSPPHSPHQSPPHSPFQSPPYSPPHSSPPRSYEAPLPEGNTSGSAEASIQLKELMVLVPSLVTRVTSLEKELKETKQTLGNVVVKLVKKVKSLEKALKRKSKKVIVSASEGEEPEDQGRIIQDIDDDPLVSLVRESMKEKSTDFVTPTKASGEAQEEEISPTILEAAKTLSKVASQSVSKAKSTDKGKRYRRRARYMAKKINTGLDAEDEINTGRAEVNTGSIKDVNTGSTKVDTGRTSISTSSIIHSPKKGQREGKAQMVEEDIQATHKTKEQIRQEEVGLEEAIRLQAQMDEEVAK
ncbi:putative ribonuclease H-like domain-containing protein [Tanacetum coccineum]